MAKPVGFGGRDYPDFAATILNQSAPNISDLSELAVRLGAVNRFDRTGNVLYQDDFSHGLGNWSPNAYPAEAYPQLSAEYFSTVPYATLLKTTTDEGSYSGMIRYFPFPFQSILGFEFHYKAETDFERLMFTAEIYTGTHRLIVSVQIRDNDGELIIYEPGGPYTKIDDINPYNSPNGQFHVIKLVVDCINEKYVRLIFDESDYNLSQYSIKKLVNTTASKMYNLFYLLCDTGVSESVWIDNFIITMNERP